MCGKVFKFMVFTFRENGLNLHIFTYEPPVHTQISPPTHLSQREIIHSPSQHVFENLFPPLAERGIENYAFSKLN